MCVLCSWKSITVAYIPLSICQEIWCLNMTSVLIYFLPLLSHISIFVLASRFTCCVIKKMITCCTSGNGHMSECNMHDLEVGLKSLSLSSNWLWMFHFKHCHTQYTNNLIFCLYTTDLFTVLYLVYILSISTKEYSKFSTNNCSPFTLLSKHYVAAFLNYSYYVDTSFDTSGFLKQTISEHLFALHSRDVTD